MEEPSCFRCGAKTGGDLRKHHDGCTYVQELCEKYPACQKLAGKVSDGTRKGPRKNSKHGEHEDNTDAVRTKENRGRRLKVKRPQQFLLYSGFYGDSLPEYFVLEEEENRKKGGVSYCVSDPRLPEGVFMKLQWFNASHFEK